MKKESNLRLLLEEIENLEGGNTELVSLYIPPERDIARVRNRVSNNRSESQNIKSEETRKNVQKALSSIESILSNYKEVPDNGMVIFCGSVNGSIKRYIIDNIPNKMQSYRYHCDSKFLVSPLKNLLKSQDIFGLIVVDRRNAQIGELRGNIIKELDTLSSNVPGKHNKGGQSSGRFDRIIEEKKDVFFKEVAELANKRFVDKRHDMKGILIGGPSPSRKYFTKQELLHHELQNKIIAEVDISDTKDNGLKEIVEKSKDIINKRENLHKKETLTNFFKRLKKDDKVIYGLNETMEAIEYGAVDKLLIGKDIDFEIDGDSAIKVLSEKNNNKGGETILIPKDIEKGKQFHEAFGGVGAILRYNY